MGIYSLALQLPRGTSYGSAYWPDNGEIDIMEQVGYDPTKIVSSVHTAAFNHLKNTQPTNGVHVPDACDDFKVYTMDWNTERLEMFVGSESNPFEQRVLIWERDGHSWEGW